VTADATSTSLAPCSSAATSASRLVLGSSPSTGAPPIAAGSERRRQPLECRFEQCDEVDRIPPGVGLLHPLGERELGGKTRQHALGAVPTGDVEGLERLVHEVEGVATVEVAVIGRGRKEHFGELHRRRTGTNGRDDRPLRAFCVAHLDETAEPECEPRWIDVGRRQRGEREPRRHTGGVGCDFR